MQAYLGQKNWVKHLFGDRHIFKGSNNVVCQKFLGPNFFFFGGGRETYFGVKMFCVEANFIRVKYVFGSYIFVWGQNYFLDQNHFFFLSKLFFWVQKNLWVKTIFGPEKFFFDPKKNLGPKISWVLKNVQPKKFWVSKSVWVKKIFGLKTFLGTKMFMDL